VDAPVEETKWACIYEGEPADRAGRSMTATAREPSEPSNRREAAASYEQTVCANGSPLRQASAQCQILGAVGGLRPLVADGAGLRVGLSDAYRVGICSVEIEPIV